MKKQMRWLLYAMNFLAFFAISMVNTQMIPFLSKLGYTVVQRGYILAANAVVAIAGQILFGYLCDRFQRVKGLFSFCGLCAAVDGEQLCHGVLVGAPDLRASCIHRGSDGWYGEGHHGTG
ncbi:MAG: hypothetical protein ACLTDX_18925 [[Clostridium] innocuum]